MPVRIVEWQLPYTWGTGIEIDTNKVISVLLREENNLIQVNGDNELYTDLQLVANIKPSDDFPVGVTVWKVLQSDWWTQSGLLLNWKTTSGDYARWIYANDWKIYFDNWTGTWKQVYYSSEVDNLIQTLRNYVDATYQPKLTAWTWINIGSNDVISNTLPWAIVSATAPSSPTEWMVWYDTANDVLKTYDWTNWNIVWDDAADINTKTFFISGTTEEKKTKLGQAIQYYLSWMNPILSLGNTTYTLRDVVVWDFEQGTNDVYTFSSTIKSENGKFWEIVVNVLVTAQGHGSTVNSFTDTKYSAWAVASATAPSNPSQWDMWYDTTTDTLNTYDGTQWNEAGWWWWWWDVLVSDQPNNILTSWMKIWAWTETDFWSLTPDSNTVYLLTAGQSS